ncbi:CPBP family intramembrane glutamic endopeptidase [Candidatus Microthrix sp.]|uniref:CPBP family intramembrane glutamic endopeptidase n=1 Tax=Candidatus Neomicrothrix sp. TaxID=2719034 RepID=UPI001B59DCBF|nr:CPBP family intramembrane glutamic endopeptidase [Candidatus Microthrix sp.]MBK6502097.1 CPBP family intramembrane metalloprotease [Candidatus Microthrix sp.]MBP7405815.1 CPBP family intramembrane metalloprotease [Candidatus Microthrix sp.]MBP7852457.1 CPBP family intramembrane metalloprotease [Candidatus Microthrix sp.]MBP7876429.1 CPBP family intramembrane metalloprotease [Candidatus Microthrix sp.]MBP8958374.1 CPBP family intramembrane metalloprotease [Candidatus Microthrix sp.]
MSITTSNPPPWTVAGSTPATVQTPPPAQRAVSVVGDYLRFWGGRGNYRLRDQPAARWFLPLWGLSLAVAYASSVMVTMVVVGLGGKQPDNAVGDLVENGSAIVLVITAVLLAPLLEEVAFRLPMSLRPWHVAGGVGVLSVMFVPGLFGVSLGTAIVGDRQEALASLVEVGMTVAIIVVLGLVLRLLLPKGPERGAVLIPTRARFVVIVILTAVFAAAHLGNFSEFTWFLPAFILPQLLVGMVLAYVRVTRSWWMGVGIHALNNAVAVGFGLLPRYAKSDLAQGMAGLAILGAITLLGLASIMALGMDLYGTWRINQAASLRTYPDQFQHPVSAQQPPLGRLDATAQWPHGRPPPWPPGQMR